MGGRKIKGLTFPNKQWDLYSAEEEEAIIDLAPTGILLLGYPGSSILEMKVDQDCYLWRELGEGTKVLLRPYMDNLHDWDPEDWGMECLRLLDLYEQYGIPRSWIELIPANEMNREGWGEDWLGMTLWLSQVGDIINRWSPDTLLHIPALSPDPEGRYLDGLWFMSKYYKWGYRFHKLDAHVYNLDQAALLPEIQFMFNLPLVVAEYNQMYPSTLLRGLQDYSWFEGGYWFILSWDTPEPGAPNVDLISNPDYYQDFKNYKEEAQPTMTKDELWAKISEPWDTFPALTKAIVGMAELPIGEEVVVGDYTFQLGTSLDTYRPQVAFARTGDWDNIQFAQNARELPDVEAASH